MEANEQVILVLKLALNIAPPALYFVILGLVNSQSRPNLITSRNDWLGLVVVFFPVVLFPVIWLGSMGLFWLAVLAMAIGAGGVYLSLPGCGSGWVVYNCSRRAVWNSLIASLDEHGLRYEIKSDACVRLLDHAMEFRFTGFALLRNTTISIQTDHAAGDDALILDLETSLRSRLDQVESAMNFSGPAMLVAGSSMLILPLFMMVRHIDAFVRVVSDFWPM